MKQKISLKKEAKKYEDYINTQKKNKKFLQEYEAEELREEIAVQIYQVRKKRHLTQKQLAKILSMPQQEISRIENRAQNITTDTLGKIAAGLRARVKIKISV